MTTKRWITCNACGADAFRPLGQVDEWRIGECGRCALVYVNPIPFFEPSREFSSMSLDFQYTRFQREVTPEVRAHDAQQFRRQCAEAARLAGRELDSGRFLDVGCGSGATVAAAAEQGWTAVGIDIDPALVEIGRRAHGADLRCGTLPAPGLAPEQFDLVRMRDVIEHLPNPREVLAEVRRLLVPGGVLLVATPNEGSLPARVRSLVGLPRNVVASVNPPHHLHGFQPATLRRILEATGLQPLEIRTTTPIDPLYVTARNMRSAGNVVRSTVWHAASALGAGSMLVGWAVKR